MKIKNNIQTVNIESEGLVFKFLPSGDINGIIYKNNNVSMYRGTTLDGTLGNIYLKTVDSEGIVSYTKLIGVDSPSSFGIKDNKAVYKGTFEEIDYELVLSVNHHTWFWTLSLAGNKNASVFYVQDISLNSPSANEAYNCQYLDHKVIETESGYHIVTKQNQGAPLLVQSGSLTKNISYATDGFDFFGTAYKLYNVPTAIVETGLPSKIYQYEFACHCFETESYDLSSKVEVVFYGSLVEDYNQIENNISVSDIIDLYQANKETQNLELELNKVELAVDYQNTYPYVSLKGKLYNELKKGKVDEEYLDNELVSWFDKDGVHYVDSLKELYIERPHGMVHISNGLKPIDDETYSTTCWIFGIFNSHICNGNTNLNKMLTHNKSPLNILKTSGERIFVKVDGEYFLLNLPGLYTMDVNTSTWYYQIKNDVLKITTSIRYEGGFIQTNIESLKNKKYDFIVTDNLMMGESEDAHPISYEEEGTKIIFRFADGTFFKDRYPNYEFIVDTKTNGSFKYGSDEIFFADKKSKGNPILSISYKKASQIQIIHATKKDADFVNIQDIQNEYNEKFNENINQFKLESKVKEFEKFNHVVKWYTHNALVHYASPHGLEQYGGAAWGTRDVCQGPIELFSTLKRYDLVKDTLKQIYSRQFADTYDWPQWFMFDNYRNIQAWESHGDIIVWPLRTVAYYLEQTNDTSILDVEVPYNNRQDGGYVGNDTILKHIENEVKTIVESMVEDYNLPSYGGGDWDDTLQPANKSLTKKLVSGWTVLLLIDALKKFNEFTNDYFKDLLEKITKAYNKYLLVDEIPAGFVYFGENGPELMLHPQDQKTGINYRLLPITRGMIAEHYDKKNLNKYLEIIDQNLMHNDGVRLMNTTVKYTGGKPRLFMRAETATNFGREIGLQYVHAHIRYIEAMAKIGNSERAYKGLNVVCPINIKKHVPNALPRQANVYFSSSDGNFRTRYIADKEFDLLRTGEREVKGGWRLYSSGPGIYLNQLVTNFLGVKTYQGDLVIDPVMPNKLKGTKLHYNYNGKLLNIEYEKPNKITKVILNGQEITTVHNNNKYRTAGIRIDSNLLQDVNTIIVK